MTAIVAWSLVCGSCLGLGLWSLASMVPRLGKPRLLARVAPYVADVSEGARLILARRPADPLPVIGALFAPAAESARRLLGRMLGGAATIELRLRQSAASLSLESFRSQQLVWGVCGAGAGLLTAIVASQSQTVPLAIQVSIVAVCAACGVILRDYFLQRSAAARVARMLSELPTVLEFLTLSLSAGEGILDALRRVSRISHGELAIEFGRVVAETNTGVPFADALNSLARGLQLPQLSRLVEQVSGALERGTPLAEVLRAQAQDARDDAKRRLLEVAGKKEVAMLVPLIFLILPITIVFAIFPGVFVLQMGF